jgi:G:T-mismatch repair DNA endonuclease (very short patch repair protein)
MHLFHRHKDLTDVERERLLVDIIYGKDTVDEYIQKYINEEICASDLVSVIKIDIVKLLRLMGLKRTNSEEKKTKRYKDKIESTLQARYGVSNPSKLGWVKEKVKKTIEESRGIPYDEYINRQQILMQDGYSEYRKDRSRVEQTYEKCKATVKERHGVDNVARIPAVRTENSNRAKRFFSNLSYEEKLELTAKARAAVCSRGGYSSKPEKRVRKCLVELDVDFVSNKHINKYNFDIIIGKFIIEVQGDMWHAHPSKYKETDLIMGKLLVKDIWEKDKRKRNSVEKDGYTLIEIWEHEIACRQDDEELLKFVKERLEQHGFYR